MRALGVRVEQRLRSMTLTADPGHALQVTGNGERHGPDRWTWTLAVGHRKLDPGWVIEAESAVTRVRKLVAGQDVLTGDTDFDDAVHLVGETRALLACMGQHNRKRLRRLLPQARLADGVLRWSAPATGPRPPGLVDILGEMMTAVRIFSADVPPLDRLRRNMLHDDDPGHRRRAMEQVLLAGHAFTAAERRALLRDADAELRLTVADMLHDVETLSRLASDRDLDDGLRGRALDGLGACTAAGAVAALDRVAQGKSPPDTARLGRALGRALAHDPPALHRLGEDAARALLESGPSALQADAIRRLAAVGSERSVSALAAIAGAFFGRRALKDAARAAVEAIARRQGGLRRGGLSVTDAGQGALSHAGAADGRD